MMSSRCRVCRSTDIRVFMELGDQPNTMHLLQKGQKDHLLDLTLSLCQRCGLVFIANPVQREAFYDYVQLPTSKFPAEHIDEEIQEIVDDHLNSKDELVLEVGCNDGFFLNELKKQGYVNLYGYEPSKPAAREAAKLGLVVSNEYFGREEAMRFLEKHGTPKLIVSRHVMEHVEDLDSFAEGLSILMDNDTTLFLEVPDFQSVEERADFSSIWEQHVNYFDVDNVRLLLARFGIEVQNHRTVPFSGGSLITIARKSETVQPNMDKDDDRIEKRNALSERMLANMAKVKEVLGGLKAEGKRIAGFGCGARCSGFINFSDAAQYLDYIVDDDERKYGLEMPKSRLEIHPPSKLKEDPVDFLIVLPFNSKLNEIAVMKKNLDFVESGGRFIETWWERKGGELEVLVIH